MMPRQLQQNNSGLYRIERHQICLSELHQSNLEIIATCSPRHEEYVRSLGADSVFDYESQPAQRISVGLLITSWYSRLIPYLL